MNWNWFVGVDDVELEIVVNNFFGYMVFDWYIFDFFFVDFDFEFDVDFCVRVYLDIDELGFFLVKG